MSEIFGRKKKEKDINEKQKSVLGQIDPSKQKQIDDYNKTYDNTLIQMIDESEQILMDNATFVDISTKKENKDLLEKQWSAIVEPDSEYRYLQIPFFTANKLKKGLISVNNPTAELPNYFTIMEVPYVTTGGDKLQTRPLMIPAYYRHMSTNFGAMVKLCLNLQREGELTQEMLDTLIDTCEILSPLERLIMVLSDIDLYRNLQLLNDLLSKGESMAEQPSSGDYEEAIDMVDELLTTDFKDLITREERLNPHQIGILSRLNYIYFDQFLKQDLEVKPEYAADYEETKQKFLSQLNNVSDVQNARIEQIKEALRDAAPKEDDQQEGKAPLQSFYVEQRFGDTFDYIDNMMNQFFQKHQVSGQLDKAAAELNSSYEAKLALKISDLDIRRMISQDYTTRHRVVNEAGEYELATDAHSEEERLSWMQHEFSKEDQFDPAQLNLIILNSRISYQYLKELRAKESSSPETAFSFAADRMMQSVHGAQNMRCDMPVFPFTASYMTPKDGVFIQVDNQNNKQACHEAAMIEQKIKALDRNLQVRSISPSMAPEDMTSMLSKMKLQ